MSRWKAAALVLGGLILVAILILPLKLTTITLELPPAASGSHH